jgi:GT2 family glycosyltransferase
MFKKWVKGETTDIETSIIDKKPLKPIKSVFELDFNEETNRIDDPHISDQTFFQNALKIIKIPHNRGFTGGNNIALEYILNNIETDFLLLLSNDVVVAPDFVDELLKPAENNTKIGVLGPLVYHYYDPERIQSAGGEILWKKGEIVQKNRDDLELKSEDELVDVDYITGCAIMGSKDVFSKIGLLKERYRAYWEDVEWCVRAKKAGYKIACVPKAHIWHKESVTTKKTNGFVEYHYIRNKLWFLREHASFKDKSMFFFNFFFYQIIHLIFYVIFRKKDLKILSYYLRGTWDGLFKTP